MRHYESGKCGPSSAHVHIRTLMEWRIHQCLMCRWGFSLIFGIYGSVFPYAFAMAAVNPGCNYQMKEIGHRKCMSWP